MELPERARIGAIYDFVRDEILFGYNPSDDIPASAVLADGYGQCNTKTTLLMALLRASGIGCRFHGATIDKRLQQGVMAGLLYRLAPSSIIHSWAEVFVDGRWVGLEGVILDRAYLEGIRASIRQDGGPFLGYAVGTDDLANPPIQWAGTDTRIQATGVTQDFGVFDDPDTFYLAHGVNARGIKGWLYRRLMRNAMNNRVMAIRAVNASSEVLTSEVRALAGVSGKSHRMTCTRAPNPAESPPNATTTAGMHLVEDLVIPGVLDNDYRPVSAGKTGDRLRVTVLFGRTIPLLRYEMTDRVRLATGGAGDVVVGDVRWVVTISMMRRRRG